MSKRKDRIVEFDFRAEDIPIPKRGKGRPKLTELQLNALAYTQNVTIRLSKETLIWLKKEYGSVSKGLKEGLKLLMESKNENL